MWKSTNEGRPAPASAPTPTPMAPPPPPRPVEAVRPQVETARGEIAHIGKSVVIRGELSGSEDLYVDGEVEGSISLLNHSLIVGPHGRVRANVNAKDVVIHGRVEGNVRGTDKVDLRRTAVLSGDISTQRIVIEDGAFFKGAIDIQKESKSDGKVEVKRESLSFTATAGPSSNSGD